MSFLYIVLVLTLFLFSVICLIHLLIEGMRGGIRRFFLRLGCYGITILILGVLSGGVLTFMSPKERQEVKQFIRGDFHVNSR